MTSSANGKRARLAVVGVAAGLLAGIAGFLIPWTGSLSAPISNGDLIGGLIVQAIVLSGLGAIALLWLRGQGWGFRQGRMYFGILLIVTTVVALPTALASSHGVRKIGDEVQAISADEAIRERADIGPLLQKRSELFLPSLLSANAVRRPGGVAQSRADISRLKDLEVQILQARLLSGDRYDRRVRALGAPGSYTADFEAEGQRQAAVARERHGLMLAYLSKMDEQLAFLEATQGKWSVGEEIVFGQPEDAEIFQRLDREAAVILSGLTG